MLTYHPRPATDSFTGFSILIPTWNNLPFLQLCIRSLRENSGLRHQFLVHVNEGVDGTLEWVRRQPDIAYTHSPENIGICYPLNALAGLAATDYIAYFNDDMYALPGWDDVLLREIRAVGHERFFLSATMIEPYDTGNPCVIHADYGRNLKDFREDDLKRDFTQWPKPDWRGATWPPNVVHRRAWELVGGYSVEFSPGIYSDPDFSHKLWLAGVRDFRGLGAARVYHFGRQSTGRLKGHRGRTLFRGKWRLSPGTFLRHHLRLGEPITDTAAPPNVPSPTPAATRWKDRWKRLREAW